ncbi:uroporphyrinogen-III synthase, partial [bacterium]|nr:uroporphyrinogen-III synthase [bacterium]
LHKCKSNSVKPPALFIIGGSAVINTDSNENVCKLKGKRTLITGPYQNTDRISKLIRERRAEPVIYPTITLKRYYDMGAWKRVKGIVDKGGWIVFTSKMGVKEFFSQLLSAGMDYRVLGKFKFATVGDKTTNILREYGFKSDLMPKDFLATELISRMRRVKNIFNKVVVLVKGNLNDDTLSTELTKAGADIYPLQVYDNHPAHWEPQWIRKIIDHPPDYVVFSSGSTVEGLISIFGMEEALKLTERVKVVSIGPKTTEVAEANNIRVNLESEIHNMEGVLDAIGKYEENRI